MSAYTPSPLSPLLPTPSPPSPKPPSGPSPSPYPAPARPTPSSPPSSPPPTTSATTRPSVTALSSFSTLSTSFATPSLSSTTSNPPPFRQQMSNTQTWVSVALTNEDTCLDGFQGIPRGSKAPLKKKIRNIAHVINNALYLINCLSLAPSLSPPHSPPDQNPSLPRYRRLMKLSEVTKLLEEASNGSTIGEQFVSRIREPVIERGGKERRSSGRGWNSGVPATETKRNFGRVRAGE